jgi:hypothetical protein
MRSNARRGAAACLATALIALAAGCSREAPDVRAVRKFTNDYIAALIRHDVKEVADRSTCLVSANSLVGGRVLSIQPPRRVRMGAIDSLARAEALAKRTADSLWTRASDATTDSLRHIARVISYRTLLYRNAARAVTLSAPGKVVASDSTLETRAVRARFRYEGPVVGPRPVDREEILRLLRAPGGTWVVFSVFLLEEDPAPEMI